MNIRRNDFIYILAAIALAAIGTLAVGNPNTSIGLYSVMGLLGVIMVMAIIVRPSLGAYILIIAIYTNISKLLTDMGYPSTIKPLVAIVAIAILIRYLYAERTSAGESKTNRIEAFLLLFFVAVVFSFLAASDKDIAMVSILDVGKDIVIIYCIIFALRQPHSWKLAVWIIVITTALLSLLGIYQTVTGDYNQTFIGLGSVQMQQVFDTSASSTPRVGGPINAPNMWGQVLVAIIPLVLYRIIYGSSRLTKFIGAVLFLILFYEMLNTYSRGAYLALAISFVLILFQLRLNPIVPAVGLILAALLLFALPSSYIERFGSLSFLSPTASNGIYQDSSFRGRTSEMLTGLSMFAAHPLLGVGAGNYPINYQRYAQVIGIEVRAEARDPHSLYIQLLAETGILGTAAFLGIIFSLFSGLARTTAALKRSPLQQIWLPWISSIQVSLVGYLIAAFFLHDAYIRYFWILVAIAITGIKLTDEMLENLKQSTPFEASF